MMRVLPSGDTALLVEFEDTEQALALYQQWLERPRCEVLDIIPSSRTVLFKVDPKRTALTTLASAIQEPDTSLARRSRGPLVEIPVHYDGADLADVARLLGREPGDVVEYHTSREWRVAFCGFAPGFAYLSAPDEPWHTPRRDNPRTHVPAGAVGLAGPFSGVYPRSSPGGWQLIGSTTTTLFDPKQSPPALLTPGTRVRFIPAETSRTSVIA